MKNGWRARIGVIAPVGSHVDAILNHYAPEGVAFDGVCLPESDGSAQGALAMVQRLHESAAVFRGQPNKLLFFGSASGSFAGGDACAERMEQASGIPALTAAQAALEAFGALGAGRAAVMTPYGGELNALTAQFLSSHGVTVQSITGAGMNGFTDYAYPDLRFLYRSARALELDGAEVFFLCGLAYETLELVRALEADLRIPVVTGQQAALWACLRHAGLGDELPGLGKLFSL